MSDDNTPVTFYGWFPGFLLKAVWWNAGVIGMLRGYVWLLALDDDYATVVQGNRWVPITLALVGTVLYADADWKRRNEP